MSILDPACFTYLTWRAVFQHGLVNENALIKLGQPLLRLGPICKGVRAPLEMIFPMS